MARARRPKQTAADVLRNLAQKVSYEVRSLDKDSGRGAGVRWVAKETGLSEETVRRFMEQASGEPHAVHFETAFRLARVVFYEIRLVKSMPY